VVAAVRSLQTRTFDAGILQAITVKNRKFHLTRASDLVRTTSGVPAPAGTSSGRTSMSTLARFVRDEQGATAIEYGLIAAGISVAIIAVVQGLGSKLNSTFTSVQNALN
jgi:pilus assembly protein Flp/PilA